MKQDPIEQVEADWSRATLTRRGLRRADLSRRAGEMSMVQWS